MGDAATRFKTFAARLPAGQGVMEPLELEFTMECSSEHASEGVEYDWGEVLTKSWLS